MNTLTLFRCLAVSGLILAACGACSACGQDARQELAQAIVDLRSAARAISEAGTRYYHGSREESQKNRDDFEAATVEGERQMKVVEQALLRLLRETTELSEDEFNLAVEIQSWMLSKGMYYRCYEFGTYMVPDEGEAAPPVALNQALAGLATDHFDEAFRYIEMHPQVTSSLPQFAEILLPALSELRAKYERELKLRAAEADADDLPRVLLKTTKGRIEVELYENEAPDTVGNFIYLVEKGHYTDVAFHRVIADNIAQTGGYAINGEDRNADYMIFDECNTTDARHHFYATLSMAVADLPNTGGSQFFITLLPCPHLDGKHTVFGRVISGFVALESITRTHKIDEKSGETPIEGIVHDRILSAEVIRKRDHEYKPRKVSGQ